MTDPSAGAADRELSRERADLLETLDKHRGFLRFTVRNLTDDQAARRTTASELCLGGLIKHVTGVEARWMRFAVGGAAAMRSEPVDWEGQFRMGEGETLAGLLDAYERTAAETDRLVADLDLDAAHALPEAPWFEPGATWSVRRVLLHVIAETSQHAGHADIIRESLDGARTMG
ncbi:DinB family protein [Streptomyces sp. NRRL B-24484]|uniref:DinB family protein n=1 Tax=Streptomyces sp. NRRL B-24484 TaxID=1463833 RepID=UPI0004C1C194|nr:DinB family protein [Streptomyces sp. NRRL B-24484]